MKFKTSAIALAVAGSVAAPMAAQAEGSVYASARVGLENVDTAGISDVRMRSFGSRFGARGETDLGNGMSGFGRYEWDVDFASSNTSSNDDISIRHRYVGLKGDFGSMTIGQTYHTFYNHVVGPLDQPWWASGYAMVNYRGRTDGAVTYAGSAGAIDFGVTGYFLWEPEEELPDQIEAAVSFGVGNLGTVAVALQNTADNTSQGSAGNDEDIVAVTWHGITLGDATMGIGFMNQDEDDSITFDLGIGNIRVHFETLADDSADNDPTMVMLGYTQSLGRNTTAWYEVVSYDADTSNSDDDVTVVRGVLKYDIL
ncbi:MAG: porin [Gammaproteobacteria bacterium]